MRTQLLALALLVLIPAALAQTVDLNEGASRYDVPNGEVYVTQLRYEPFPASPGSYIDVWYKIENRGDTSLQNLKFVLEPRSPFVLDSDDATKTVGSLGPREAALVHYEVRVRDDAAQGTHTLRYSWNADGGAEGLGSHELIVRSTNSLLLVSGVEVTPSVIKPGEQSTVNVDLTNAGDSFLRYVTVGMQLVTVGQSGQVVELPFTPVGKGVTQTLVNLAPGKTGKLSFDLLAAPDSESKAYKVPISITYVDSQGVNKTANEIVGIRVTAEPDLVVYVDKNGIVDNSAPGEVVLRFVNKGLADIKFLTVTLQQTDAYTVINSPEQYVGEVKSDDYETVGWDLRMKENSDTVDLPVLVTYEDINGKKHSTGMSVPLSIYGQDVLGTQGNGYANYLLAGIAIVVLGYVFWRRRSKKPRRG